MVFLLSFIRLLSWLMLKIFFIVKCCNRITIKRSRLINAETYEETESKLFFHPAKREGKISKDRYKSLQNF